MKLFLLSMLAFSLNMYAQNKPENSQTFKGEHYALYNKCLSAVTFCELTQQTYTSCGSVKNCYGLYVLPGDTFYVNIEDKTQAEIIKADISFGGYLASVSNFTFEPIDINCMPQQALQIVIPMNAIAGSSFQIVAQNTSYVSSPTYTPGVPPPFNVFVGGLQPQFTFALSDFTACATLNDVSVKDMNGDNQFMLLSSNPAHDKIEIINRYFQIGMSYILTDYCGKKLDFGKLEKDRTEILLNEIDQGLYIISFYLNGRFLHSQKIIHY